MFIVALSYKSTEGLPIAVAGPYGTEQEAEINKKRRIAIRNATIEVSPPNLVGIFRKADDKDYVIEHLSKGQRFVSICPEHTFFGLINKYNEK